MYGARIVAWPQDKIVDCSVADFKIAAVEVESSVALHCESLKRNYIQLSMNIQLPVSSLTDWVKSHWQPS